MKKLYSILLILTLCLTGCGEKEPQEPSSTSETSAANTEIPSSAQIETSAQDSTQNISGFTFSASNGIEIYMHQEASDVLSQLGEPKSYLETPSCAFQDGTDKIYTYPSFTITTYDKDGKDFIYDIYFNDDTITTKEGIYIGCTLDKLKEIYGNDYTEEFGMYTYTKDGMRLMFLTQDNIVTSVEYNGFME